MQKNSGKIRNLLLVGLLTALSSEVYLSLFVDNFRISPAVIVFAAMLMTTAKKEPVPATGIVTAVIVLALRVLLQLGQGPLTRAILLIILPGAAFYLIYSLLFSLLVRNRFTSPILRVAILAGACDLLSNCAELLLRALLSDAVLPDAESLIKVALVAAVRALLLYAVLLLNRQYHFLLKKEEHERRYRQLFLLTTDLKSELYLMKKNSEQIESVMKSAYTLYEELKDQNYPKELQTAGLDIAREVHDIKKDYYRVIRGIEEELEKDPDSQPMAVSDLMRILTEAAHTDLHRRGQNAAVITRVEWPFETGQHYALMSVLMNLVNNAVEALELQERPGRIEVRERLEGDSIVFEVEDTGKGISGRHLPHIFEMGYSSKFDLVTGNIYRGVGLSSVKQIVEEQFGGTIRVESQEGYGTCFTVSIPAGKLTERKL